MALSPIAIEWTISNERLYALKNATQNEFLESKKFSAFPSAPDIQYFLRVYPNHKNQGKVGIYLCIISKEEVELVLKMNLSIESAGWTTDETDPFIFTAGDKEGRTFGLEMENFFDKSKKFIVDEKCVILLAGCLAVRTPKSSSQGSKPALENYVKLWNQQRRKDFTISVGSEEIKVHKVVLESQSPLFQALFNSPSKKKGRVQKKGVIADFPFKVVESAIKACYGIDVDSNTPIQILFSVMKFADQYEIITVKNYIEQKLLDKIDAFNVCDIIQLTTDSFAERIREKCIEFIKQCMEKNIFITDIDELDQNILVEIIEECMSRKCQTL